MSENVSLSLLPDLLDYNSETGVLTWTRRDVSFFKNEHFCRIWNSNNAGKEAFTASDTSGYRLGRIFSKNYKAHRVIWALVHKQWPECIDHIDGCPSNNRISNLRNVTRAENNRNRRLGKDNTSGVMGVCWCKKSQKWLAQIEKNDRNICLGRFESKNEAAAARKEAEKKLNYHPNHGRSS